MEAGIAASLHCRRPQAGSFARPGSCLEARRPGREAPGPLPGHACACHGQPTFPASGPVPASGGRVGVGPRCRPCGHGRAFVLRVRAPLPRVEPRKARRRTDPRGSEGSALRSAFALAGPVAPGGGIALAARYALLALPMHSPYRSVRSLFLVPPGTDDTLRSIEMRTFRIGPLVKTS